METRAAYNQAKTDILEIVQDLGEATTGDVSELTGKRYETASMLMLAYHRFGLLSRYRQGRAYIYSITARGLERLNWLTQDDSER